MRHGSANQQQCLSQPARRVCYSATLVGALCVRRNSTGAQHKEDGEQARDGCALTSVLIPSATTPPLPSTASSKLRLWQLTEYAKLVFIDSDLLLLTSVDFLFSYPEISARGNDGSDFNSGVMVLEPSDCTFELLMGNLERVRSANGGDQVRP
ncbi:unnamed protein product [Closterium sp. NIES-54]